MLAGLIVIVIEWGWRFCFDLHQRRQAVRQICALFEEWETAINTASGFEDPQVGIGAGKEVVQFAKHKYYLWTIPIMMSRWAKHLPGRHAEEIARLVANHEHSVVRLVLPHGVLPQQSYDDFFGKARDIEWLKF